jgi:hypothetical protein
MTADFWQQRKMHQIGQIHLFKKSRIGIFVLMQNTFLFEAPKETHEQRKTKIAYLFTGQSPDSVHRLLQHKASTLTRFI